MKANGAVMESAEHTKAPPRRRMTEQDFVDWCDSETWAEWVDGEVILVSPVSRIHDDFFGFLLTLMRLYVENHDMGVVLTEPMQVRLAEPLRRRSPDILFIQKAREKIIRETWIEGPPDLIIEIVSPESVARDWRDKYNDYEKAGVREYWIVDPNSRKVEAYSLNRSKRFQLLPETTAGIQSRALKGFFLKSEWLWQAKLPKVASILRQMNAL
ncbi:MAG TPA: Uma2 family endonuclease [Planctomycetota bacterium]|jgi:Uma2 family endonuclease